jgi:nicotinamide riboside kinase
MDTAGEIANIMIRIAVTGPESSGKSTLSSSLASALNGILMPEYARDFLMKTNGLYIQSDLDTIARGQLSMWKGVENEYVICDTEMLVLKIWSTYKYGNCSEFIINSLHAQQFDQYFLCSPDIPWEEDSLREHPLERAKLFEIYRKELIAMQVPFTILEGNHETRMQVCLNVISTLRT